MKIEKYHYVLESGSKMPKLGMGTFLLNGKIVADIVCNAIVDLGYRHIDTAAIYGNEKEVGDGIRKALEKGVKREDLFITTKLWLNDKNRAEAALRESVSKLQLDYVDCYLIHWPMNYREVEKDKFIPEKIPLHVLWKNLEICVEKGLTRNIGLSNFNCQIIIDLLTYCNIKPCCNQIEIHPYLTQEPFVNWLKDQGIAPVAYSALGNLMVALNNGLDSCIKDKVVVDLAKKYKKSPAQILLNWGQRNHIVLAKSTKIARLKENINSMNFELSKEDMAKITALNKNLRLFDPINGSFDLYYPLFK